MTVNAAIPAGGAAFAGYYEQPRLALLDLVDPRRVEKVLEVGCGGGANLAELQRRHPGCRTTGVELRTEAAAAARGRVDAVVVGDVLDAAQVFFPAAHFDVVVLSHVLEHFAEPERVLDRVRGWLAPGGQVLVALPNLRHASVLVELLWRADFRYRPAGILDRTHLRFYTRKSALRFLGEAGWRVEACRPDIQGPRSRRIARWTLGWLNDVAAFAYNFRLRAA